MYLRCLKTLALEILVLVLYLASVALLIITSFIKIKWKVLSKIYFGIFIAIMFITVSAVFTQISLIVYKERDKKVFMIKYSIGRAVFVICINLVELILLLREFDNVNYPCKDKIMIIFV